MEEIYTPTLIAKQLNVSTTTLRRYEDQGLIPDVPRTASNRRCYTSIHVQAFITIRALLQGYEIPVVYDVMRKIKGQQMESALWAINQEQHNTQVEKERLEEVLRMFRDVDLSKYKDLTVSDSMTIGEVAQMAGVNPSAIRHWEQEGLISSNRNKDNGYRVFTLTELRKIILISSLRKTVYYIENMKQLLNEIETHNYKKVEISFQLALQKLNSQLMKQFFAIAELTNYVKLYKSNAE
ncbi:MULTISPECIES: MerR family DNA-binding transcriptional regulator [Paenibacillus]|uniref:MerR family DNA-binding transcriptional regulator n=1 Tax=Paenibacillus TaxID=44249 RepID=UPI00096EF765|nr:MerR family DNA-binding transcriptional regulator [Paenibacillus odorifer]OMC80572.1 MerR family transcriptional regulator [Paenibacillus odorifer]OMD79163.1 MerR family transcriptional regulator [Paenibacillus odorifer]OMD86857.1 MerR family transcriptional regulator [Paenibacillus odorifer]OMD96550.1 MerR family transcriptional regulator [Paenibacillus odorifer]OME04526.1 MerR family transcriptional regulator [Paenibacillus odorifer]